MNEENGVATHLAQSVYKALANPLRHQIVMRTGERPWCPSEIAADLGEPLKKVCEQIEILLNWEPTLLEPVEERSGPRGGVVHFYRAVRRFRIEAEEWERLSPIEKATQTTTITEQLHREWIDSIKAGAFYEDPDHALMRTPLNLDRVGMKRLVAILIEAQDQFAEVERESIERCRETGEKPKRVITSLTSFLLATQPE